MTDASGNVVSIHGVPRDLSQVTPEDMERWRNECLAAFPVHKKYQVIYADPPWSYRASGNVQGKTGYPTMSMDELKRLPVSDACASTCVLFMWTTNPMLPEALELIRAWGFEYKTVFKAWLKRTKAGAPMVGVGWWSRPSTELMLVATRGSGYMKWKRTHSEPQEYESTRGRHSEKPEALRDSVRGFFDVESRLELFARSTAEGFDAWGLEIPGFFHTA